ncbi:MAG: hypothetical protein ACAI38_20045 [Myxococcota bacterium]|nr:hypothetical protein [Myxococcota bacterium]
MKLVTALVLLGVLGASPPARAQDILDGIVDAVIDGGNDFAWEKVELPGTVCGNGSPYKFFVSRTGSPNVLFYFEGGGACWDYDTCSGRLGQLGAANPNGIPDDYMQGFRAQYATPVVNGADPGIPFRSRTELVTAGWNVVFMPYCTGDVHVGNNTAVYLDATGAEPPLQWSHSGFANTIAAAQHARTLFPAIEKLLVAGYSAGGTATSAAYYFVRRTLAPARGYYLNDSGPIHLAPNVDDHSRPLHDKIRGAWALEAVLAQLPTTFDVTDLGSINGVLAREFPNDRLAYTGYNRDYNYSRFSYELFLTPNDQESVLAYWKADQDALLASLEEYPNVSYFVPHARPINDSHCSTVITFIGSHACQEMQKKRRWYEYFEWPPGQSYKCYSEFVPMEVFLWRFVNEDQLIRIHEPPNGYNDEDIGMSIVAPIINAALEG